MFTADVTAQDVLLAHTNGQDIKDANGTATVGKIKKGTTLEAFGIEETDNTQDDGTPPLDEVEEVTENEEVTDEVEELVEEEAETFEL